MGRRDKVLEKHHNEFHQDRQDTVHFRSEVYQKDSIRMLLIQGSIFVDLDMLNTEFHHNEAKMKGSDIFQCLC